MRAAYGFDKLGALGLNGRGRTIVIVDAFTSPTIAADLRDFDHRFDLPPADFSQIAPDGLPPYDLTDDDQVGWAGEISLDVEWAHAVAPDAKIVLVSAKSDEDADINSALRYAVAHNLGDVISQSFYENENCPVASDRSEMHRIYEAATAKGITLLASSGDVGAAQFACVGDGFVKGVAIPAADPLVTGIGGTTLNVAGKSGTYLGETTWAGDRRRNLHAVPDPGLPGRARTGRPWRAGRRLRGRRRHRATGCVEQLALRLRAGVRVRGHECRISAVGRAGSDRGPTPARSSRHPERNAICVGRDPGGVPHDLPRRDDRRQLVPSRRLHHHHRLSGATRVRPHHRTRHTTGRTAGAGPCRDRLISGSPHADHAIIHPP